MIQLGVDIAEMVPDELRYALVDKLKEIGIEIARRTVAKYREGMGIASSSIRRREKVAAAPRAKAS